MQSKFQKEIKELLEKDIISADVAERIDAYYTSNQSKSPNKLFTIFGVLGAILTGLGIILIVAHNWDNFSRGIKTMFAFLPLIIGQGFVLFSLLKKKSAAWKESSGAFLFFAVGSSISLVSQIYNIPGDVSTFLLSWLALCLPVIYILRSKAMLLLHIVFMTYYAIEHADAFYGFASIPWYYILLLAAVLPFYLNLLKTQKDSNMVSIFNWLFPLSASITLFTFFDEGYLWFMSYIFLFSVCYNIGKRPYFEDQKLRRNGYLIVGSLGVISMLMFCTFKWTWKSLADFDWSNSYDLYVAMALFAVALSLFLWHIFRANLKTVHGRGIVCGF